MPQVLVPVTRWGRWVANFSDRHGGAELTVADGRLTGRAEDGSRFTASLPFGRAYDGEPGAFAEAATAPSDWGVLLVRKGGFAIARMGGATITEHKIGQRHVQGRTKAGGQSQQRFARRRDNQARQAYEAAAGHAARLLAGVPLLVTGGDHAAIAAVLEEARLSTEIAEPWLPVPDPKRVVLDRAIVDASSIRAEVVNA